MRLRTPLAVGCLGLISILGLLRAQKPFKEYPAIEYENFPLPKDWARPAEWVRARLRYPDIYGYPNNPPHPARSRPSVARAVDYGLSPAPTGICWKACGA